VIAVIIPTLGRPEFVARQLRYYERQGGVAVYIGDASKPSDADRLAEAIRTLHRVKCVHVREEGLHERGMAVRLLEKVSEPYCALAGDDDFLVPQSLAVCASFLEANPDYRTAQGRGILFTVSGDADTGSIERAGEYWGRPQGEEPSARERLAAHAAAYWVSLFSVHRTTDYREDWAPFGTLVDRQFGEIGPSLMSVARGKSRFIDCLYLGRQVHAARTRVPRGAAWKAEAGWEPSYRTVESALAHAIAQEDGLSIEEATAAFKQAFHAYLSRAFSRRRWPRVRQVIAEGLRKAAPRLAARVRRAIRQGGQADAVELDALLETRSPYHDQFAGIAECVVSGIPPR
jgi:glycosyltransferase domain-containing protein